MRSKCSGGARDSDKAHARRYFDEAKKTGSESAKGALELLPESRLGKAILISPRRARPC
jgi:hypothetical protein